MSMRWAWLLAIVVLISLGLLVACGTKFSPSSDGLVLVASQANQVIQSFSFNLNSGSISQIGNPPGTSGTPSSMVLDPAGSYAYVIVNGSIASFKVNSDGTLTSTGSGTTATGGGAIAMDAAGKFLFVLGGPSGPVSSYAIGSGGTLTSVPSTYTIPSTLQTPSLVALTATPTVFPAPGITGTQNAVCSSQGNNPPTSEFLYAVDSVNYLVWAFSVDTSSGALGNPPNHSQVQTFATGAVPAGVAVDSCDRFLYVTNYKDNNVSAFTICNGLASQSQSCPVTPDGTLTVVDGSPFSLGAGLGPGPLALDPFGNFLYVVDQKSNQITPFKIGSVSGALTSQSPVNTGQKPTSIVIRGDGSWMFVTNFDSGNLSQYSVIPASGTLNALPAVATDNWPYGVAVK
jgi:6-phosphogluconolactonase (cycloisomerase 2 family)